MIWTRGRVKTEVLQLLESTNDPEAVAKVDTWVDAGLDDFWAQCRPWWAQRVASATVDDGVIILPPSYLGMVAIFPLGGGTALSPCTSEQAAEYFQLPGDPQYFLIEGYTMSLVPEPVDGVKYRFTYWSKGDPLTDDGSTNALLENAPMALVYAAARHGDTFAGSDPSQSRHEDAFQKQVAQLNRSSKSGRLGTGYTVMRG